MFRTFRVLSVLALVVSVVSLVVPFATTASAKGTTSLTIRVRSCPEGSVFVGEKPVGPVGSCRVPQQAVSFSVDGGAAQVVDADGNVTFTGLSAGSHGVKEVGGPTLELVLCGLRGSDQSAQVPSNESEFSVSLLNGKETVCSAFGFDPSATLTIHARVCHSDPTTDIFTECHGNPLRTAVKFGIDSRHARSLDSHGNARFRELAAGGHRLYLDGSLGDGVHVRIFCTRLGEITGSMLVQLRVDEQMTCDFYVIE